MEAEAQVVQSVLRERGEPVPRIGLFRITSAENFSSPIDRRADFYRQSAREDEKQRQDEALGEPAPAPQPLLNIPNSLTVMRVALVPLLVALYLSSHPSAPLAAAGTFAAAALTDWADGYLARRMHIISAFGAFLDPVADKLMVCTALVLLAARPPAQLSQEQVLLPVLIAVSREIAMSSLREWAAKSSTGAAKGLAVNALGKYKTALQLIGICAMYVFRDEHHIFGVAMSGHAARWLRWGPAAALATVWLSVFFSVWSFLNYTSGVWHFFRYPNGALAPGKAR